MGWKTAVGAGLLGGLAGFIGGYIVKGNQSKIPNTKELKENLRKECDKFLKSIKKDLKQSKEATIWYKKVEKCVENILSIVNSLPDIESKSAASTSKLNKLKLEADKLDKVTRILFEEAEKNKYISNPGILTWLTYSTGDLINAYDKLTEVKSFSNIVVEDSWYTRMQSNLETRQQATFKGWMDKGRSDDEAYERELAKRGIGEGRSLVGKSASQLEVTRGKLTGIKDGLKYGTVGGLGAGAALGAGIGSVVPVVGTAIGAGVGAVGGALAGGIGGAIFNGNRRAKKELKNIQRDRLRHLDAVDSEIARSKKLAVK